MSIKGDDSIQLTERTSLGYQGITLNVGNTNGVGKPFKTRDTPLAKHPELREAFELSLDRDVINKVVFFDENVPGCSAVSPVSKLEPDLKCPGRDVEQAKQLIAESGVKTPIELPLMVEASSQTIRLGEVIQAMAKEAGFAVKVQPTEFTTALDRADAGDYDVAERRLVGPRGPGRQPLQPPVLDRAAQLRGRRRQGDRRPAQRRARGERPGASARSATGSCSRTSARAARRSCSTTTSSCSGRGRASAACSSAPTACRG